MDGSSREELGEDSSKKVERGRIERGEVQVVAGLTSLVLCPLLPSCLPQFSIHYGDLETEQLL